eukprot:scaffold3307_cov265-Pinguiococcus_pyrenoidosus.AAC.7
MPTGLSELCTTTTRTLLSLLLHPSRAWLPAFLYTGSRKPLYALVRSRRGPTRNSQRGVHAHGHADEAKPIIIRITHRTTPMPMLRQGQGFPSARQAISCAHEAGLDVVVVASTPLHPLASFPALSEAWSLEPGACSQGPNWPSGDEVGVVFLVAKPVENGHVAVPTVRCLVQPLRHLLDELQEGGSPRPEDPRVEDLVLHLHAGHALPPLVLDPGDARGVLAAHEYLGSAQGGIDRLHEVERIVQEHHVVDVGHEHILVVFLPLAQECLDDVVPLIVNRPRLAVWVLREARIFLGVDVLELHLLALVLLFEGIDVHVGEHDAIHARVLPKRLVPAPDVFKGRLHPVRSLRVIPIVQCQCKHDILTILATCIGGIQRPLLLRPWSSRRGILGGPHHASREEAQRPSAELLREVTPATRSAESHCFAHCLVRSLQRR